MGLETAPQRPVNVPVGPLVTPADPNVMREAVEGIGDAFRKGFITADEVVQRIGARAKAREKADIATAGAQQMVAEEFVQPAAQAARLKSQLAGQQLEDLKLKAAMFDAIAKPNALEPKLEVLAKHGVPYSVDMSKGITSEDVGKINDLFGQVFEYQMERGKAATLTEGVKDEPLSGERQVGSTIETFRGQSPIVYFSDGRAVPRETYSKVKQFANKPFATWVAEGKPKFDSVFGGQAGTIAPAAAPAPAPAAAPAAPATAPAVTPAAATPATVEPKTSPLFSIVPSASGPAVKVGEKIVERTSLRPGEQTENKIVKLPAAAKMVTEAKSLYDKYRANHWQGASPQEQKFFGWLSSLNPLDITTDTFNTQMLSGVPNLARGVFGEVGVLTDRDIAFYKGIAANAATPQQKADAMFEMLRNRIQGEAIPIIQSYGESYAPAASLKKTLGITDEAIKGFNASIASFMQNPSGTPGAAPAAQTVPGRGTFIRDITLSNGKQYSVFRDASGNSKYYPR